jgi:hypothetical protein
MSKRPSEQLQVRNRRIEIDARATRAYFACRSVRRGVSLERLSVAELNAILAVRKLIVLPAHDETLVLRAVGGFEAFELVAALSLRGYAPSSVSAQVVESSHQAVNTAIQAELLAALSHPATAGPISLVEIVQLLTPSNALAVFGHIKPTRKQIAQVCRIDMRRYTPPRHLASGPDSDILMRILMG